MNEKPLSNIQRFLNKESSAGIILIGAAVAAIIIANTPLFEYYKLLINTRVSIEVGEFAVTKPLLLWVNDGLMAIFFFLIGLELKRELVEGQLATVSSVVLPAAGAIGGMLIPAGIFVAFNIGDPVALRGWAIPAATDIAFALGVLALLGNRVPISLKIFLTSLAIFDDVGGILIIAFFYTSKLSMASMTVALSCLVVLFILNQKGVYQKSLYLMIGLVMWLALLKSGVHATLAGILMAMFIPLKVESKPDYSPLKSLEHDLHAGVAYIVLPVFAFCNAGINLGRIGYEEMTHSVPIGIALSLFLGKQIGVFTFCWVAIKLEVAKLPEKASYGSLYGIATLCGIGFTMSLFISTLAYQETGVNLIFDKKIGILAGSVLSAVVGYLILSKTLPKSNSS